MMVMNRSTRGLVLAAGLAFGSAFLVAGCGSGSTGEAPSTINPELEKKTDEMLKNKSQQYNARAKSNGGKVN